MPLVGVLALQGDFREHSAALDRLGVQIRLVRHPEDLEEVRAIVIPGGESTTIGRLARRHGLVDGLRSSIDEGLPTLGTCAGMIFLASRLTTGRQDLLEVLDVTVERNAFGRQNDSFEVDLDVSGLSEPFPGVFIRAPRVEKVGGGVDVLATIGEHPVLVRQDSILAAAFHPELTDDSRIHRLLLEMIG